MFARINWLGQVGIGYLGLKTSITFNESDQRGSEAQFNQVVYVGDKFGNKIINDFDIGLILMSLFNSPYYFVTKLSP